MPSLTIRQARSSDADSAVVALRSSIIILCMADHQNDYETLEHWLRNKNPETFQSWLKEPKNYTIVACFDDEVTGVGLITTDGDLNLCYVKPGNQRSGIGRAIVQELEAKAKDWGLSTINLISTFAARSFYESQGYRLLDAGNHSYGVIVDYYYAKHL